MVNPAATAVVLLALAGSLGGCAAPPASARTTSPRPADAEKAPVKVTKASPEAEGAMVVCRMERPTGSNIVKRVCRRKDDLAREREAAQQALTQPRGSRFREQ